MEYRQLGKTDLKVSSLCLGTMTWGEQNTEKEAFVQLDCAVDYGVNFIDTAEMYPVPPREETYTTTESIIGRWLKKRGHHKDLIIATKVAGPGMSHVDNGNRRMSAECICRAVEGSLQRLGVECIDLYQLHWPDRQTNFFGKLDYSHVEGADGTPIEVTLKALDDLMKAGKIRHYGLSNETAWGTMKHLSVSENNQYIRPVSIQNPYNLLNRTFEIGLAEISHKEQIGLLAYSPLGFGVLSGKYRHGQLPKNARLTLFDRFMRYTSTLSNKAVDHYCDIAVKFGLNPAQMALQFVTSRSFVTSNIIGATTLEQLESNLKSVQCDLSDEVMEALEDVHKMQPNPSP